MTVQGYRLVCVRPGPIPVLIFSHTGSNNSYVLAELHEVYNTVLQNFIELKIVLRFRTVTLYL